jgi:thiamine-phosphate pyrophosphorylase
VVLLVNDRCDLAMAIDADGVHLGQDDLPYVDARRLLGSHKLIGLSTHNAEQVHAAGVLQPDYIGFGPIFRPGSKADHDPLVGIEGLKRIRPFIRIPVFAIGGIQITNVEPVIQAGADGVAVVSAVLGAADVTMAVREFIARMPRPVS